MLSTRTICLPCRLRLLTGLYDATTSRAPSSVAFRPDSKDPHRSRACRERKTQLKYARSRFITTNESSVAADVEPPDQDFEATLTSQQGQPDASLQANDPSEVARSQLNPEDVARHARKTFGDSLPDGALRDHEYKIYERLYGAPLSWRPDHEDDAAETSLAQEEQDDMLLKEAADGSLEQIEYDRQEAGNEESMNTQRGDTVDSDEIDASLEHVDPELRDDIKAMLAETHDISEEVEQVTTDLVEREPEEEPNIIDPSGKPPLRTHPFTLVNRTGTDPTTISLPKEAVTAQVSKLLSDTTNQHLRETAGRLLGGPGLPYSTGTPRISRTKPQKPIPLSAFQSKMLPKEAGVYLAAIMPGMYASLMHVLVESRRNLGTGWLESLLRKEGGPSILDAGAGGAGVLAWREILQAEHARLREEKPELNLPVEPILGKSTVLTASGSLRQRMSTLLNNTTFLPRLPDYVHLESRRSQTDAAEAAAAGQPHGRKSFDIILAPHSLWALSEDWARRQHIQNLWAMLNPDGGVLVLLEKGVPRGFEVLAGARQYLLDELFITNSATSSPTDPSAATSADPNPTTSDDYEPKQTRRHQRHAAPGAIIAPCTTHAKCPMYRIPGISRQRKDYCRFAQRYIRPAYQQNILGAKSRNHEDVEFSYVSVIKGREAEDLGRVGGRERLMGRAATDRAFRGWDVGDADLVEPSVSSSENTILTPSVTASDGTQSSPSDRNDADTSTSILTPPAPHSNPPHPLTLPRLILPPLKKPRHVHLDVCTPSGTLERWSVARGWSRQAYRDARKSAWGDLWALGAKTREGRRVRLGKAGGSRGVVVDGMREDGDEVGIEARGVGVEEDGGESDSADVREGVEGGTGGARTEATAPKARRRPRTLTGRLKARTRKRAERAEMIAARSQRSEAVDDED